MKRRNEFLVGLSVVVALAAVIGGVLFLSEASIGRREVLRTARFRSVGRLQPGAPVLLRGVRIGRVEALRLADQAWVETDLRIARDVELPDDLAVIAVSASLFGEWQALLVGRSEVTDPQVQAQLAEAARDAGDRLPGADLPDIGELTAQASRIAADVGLITDRIESAIDSSVIADLRQSVHNFRGALDELNQFARTETGRLGTITRDASRVTATAAAAAERLDSTLGRVERATRDGRIDRMMSAGERITTNVDSVAADLKLVAASARESRNALVHVLASLDTVMTRLQVGRGTLGLLSADSTLYREATATVSELRALIADIKANPRKYFRFSVF